MKLLSLARQTKTPSHLGIDWWSWVFYGLLPIPVWKISGLSFDIAVIGLDTVRIASRVTMGGIVSAPEHVGGAPAPSSVHLDHDVQD
jgi:hypothetical protein